tara:strand:- start:4472 stop:5629 length:1158 start_codon:yes stop_codon:yes gene_type:complete
LAAGQFTIFSLKQLLMSIPSIEFDPDKYSQQLIKKVDWVVDLLAGLNPPQATIFESPPIHFRMRAEFRIWHDKKTVVPYCFYAMFEKNNPKQPVRVNHYPIGSTRITSLMQPLLEAINGSSNLSHKLFQIEFLSTSIDECLVSLIYHRRLDDEWYREALILEQSFNIHVIGRARKQRLVVSRDYVHEYLQINGKNFHYLQQENSFTQPNAAINQQMIRWVCNAMGSEQDRDLLELYCGNGNFTIPLADYFRQIIATEMAKSSIKMASKNCELNQVDNINFIRLSAQETTAALNQEREFRRLEGISLADYDFSTVLVDPPRAGLDQSTLQLVAKFETIIYISCNPLTLKENLEILSQSHNIEDFAIFDQFPYTEHCESGVILKKLA